MNIRQAAGVNKMIRTVFVLVGLLCLASAAQAEHFPPSAIVQVCSFNSDHDRANCDAFLRGSLERLQARAIEGQPPCRKEPFGPADIQDFLQFASTSRIPDSGEAVALAFNFWGSRTDRIPCSTVPGHWTNAHLLELCRADNSGGSPCKFYETALVGVTRIEEVINNTRYFCPKGSAIVPDEEVLEKFRSWVAADPGRAEGPAALGYIDAISAAYPC